MAVSEQVIPVNPTASLYTPKAAKRSEGHAMSAEQVELALGAVEDREKVILRLAVFAGMGPGELLAIQREHVKKDASVIDPAPCLPWEVCFSKERLGADGGCPSVHLHPPASVD